MIETYKTKFILEGSSARKLNRGGANLLAGRAFQIIRNIDGFRSFLEVAAQMNGKTLNFLKISRDHPRELWVTSPFPEPLFMDNISNLLLLKNLREYPVVLKSVNDILYLKIK